MSHHRLVDVHGALGCAGGATGEVQERRVLGVGGSDLEAVAGAGQEPVVVLRAGDGRRLAVVADQEDVLQAGQRGPERRHLPLVEPGGGHQDAGPTDREAGPDGLGAEGREERTEDASLLERAESRHVELGDAAGQGIDAVAFRHAKAGQGAGKAVREVLQAAVREVLDLPVLPEPPEG